MILPSILLTGFSLLSLASAAALDARRSSNSRSSSYSSWPNGPFVTSGSSILDASGNTVTYAGTNWPGHGVVMIPEGLQYSSISSIVSKVKQELGMNVFRLTYAIEMVDQIYENDGQDIDLRTAFIAGLGEEEGLSVLEMVLENNPQFSESTTRLEVYDAVVEEATRQEVYIHLDNHVSKGKWCCYVTDGNSWFGDEYFDTDNWVRGLGYMANYGKKWPSLMSMSLRNELRSPDSAPASVQETYNWLNWYSFIQLGASAINAANPDLLIFLSGLSYDLYITPVFRGTALEPSDDTYFSWSDFSGYEDKLVLEIHNYEGGTSSCDSLTSTLYNNGFGAMHPEDEDTVNVFPVMLTEFGFAMDGSTYQSVYSTCLAEYLPSEAAGWMIWVLAGSYYERSGTQDSDESWGLLNHDWSDWRDEAYVSEQCIPMVEASLS